MVSFFGQNCVHTFLFCFWLQIVQENFILFKNKNKNKNKIIFLGLQIVYIHIEFFWVTVMYKNIIFFPPFGLPIVCMNAYVGSLLSWPWSVSMCPAQEFVSPYGTESYCQMLNALLVESQFKQQSFMLCWRTHNSPTSFLCYVPPHSFWGTQQLDKPHV